MPELTMLIYNITFQAEGFLLNMSVARWHWSHQFIRRDVEVTLVIIAQFP